ncbi:MAG: M28 family peptidase [Chloroflexi bacterium]|nr:M28 family peptidase [Chloroflexota bacterium]
MADTLLAETLMRYVRALADDIGPRPAGTPREQWAHDAVRQALADMGITEVETIPFEAPQTWSYSMMLPPALALAGNLLPGRLGRLVGGLLALHAAYSVHTTARSQRTLLAALAPMGPSATQVVRLPAAGEPRHKLVFIGHVDANKHRLSFSPSLKPFLKEATTAGIIGLALNGAIQLLRAVGPRQAFRTDYRLTLLGITGALAFLFADEQGPWVDGANDNATAVACLLGLAGYFKAHPLQHTDVWLAFTGAEEVGGLGTHALLDAYGDELQDAYFFDFELVGAGRLAYVTRHSSLSSFGTYTPDAESVALAAETARRCPELGVKGLPMTILEEVGALRGRGYRGLCLVGVGDDGFVVNWHQTSDVTANLEPATLDKAARFGLAFAQTLDEQ